MSNAVRRKAISAIAGRPARNYAVMAESETEIYGEDVFNLSRMRESLPKNVYKKLLATIKAGEPLDPVIADDVANAIRQWAISRGEIGRAHV